MDKDTVKKVAKLARLDVTEEDLDYYAPQLQNIMKWFEELREVDTEGVEPLASVSEINARLREDVINDGDIQDRVLSNAPENLEGFFVVPKVVE